jgi:hypothetical protein
MAKRQKQNKQPLSSKKSQLKSAKEFELINPNAAGIDIGASEHWVSVPGNRDSQHVRRFDCTNVDI